MMILFDIKIMQLLLSLPGILLALGIHGFAHAYAANKLGYVLTKKQGRLTLSPLPHIDILGFFVILFTGIGWGKPVKVNAHAFKQPVKHDVVVSLTGGMANITLAFILVGLLKSLTVIPLPTFISATIIDGIWQMGMHAARINIMLFVFNLIPLYPLDGYQLSMHFIPYQNRPKFHKFQRFSYFIILLIAVSPIHQYTITPIITNIFHNMMVFFRIGG